ncbi:hypothetical protein EDB86DRAFT_2831141 [Lactarius hatsudake]|nr:hypothetical protein EDB86DRAFT_2831141 [Lactarius hatsudake]
MAIYITIRGGGGAIESACQHPIPKPVQVATRIPYSHVPYGLMLSVTVLPAHCGTQLGSRLLNTENAKVVRWEGVMIVVMTDRSWLHSTTRSGKGKVAVAGQTLRAH